MFINFLEYYLKAISIKGLGHKYTKDTLVAFKEYYSIIRKEDSIFIDLVTNHKDIELDEANDILNSLDILKKRLMSIMSQYFVV